MIHFAIDVGQTGCRAVAIDPSGRASRPREGPGFAHRPGTDPVNETLRVVGELIGVSDVPDEVGTVAAGVTGFPSAPTDQRRLAQLLGQLVDAERVLVAADMVTAHLGALAGRPGVCIVAGTGSVALAAGPRGHARADGWGYLLGDDGGGFWLGQAGLAAALRTVDGRPGGSEPLGHKAMMHFDTELSRIPERIYGSHEPVSSVARFAEFVIQAAEEDDRPSRQLVSRAANLLAETTETAMGRAFERGNTVAVSWAGRLLAEGRLLFETFRTELHRRCPQADTIQPAADPLGGAIRLAKFDVPDHLRPLIVEHERGTQ